jgi:hypothetical protein
MGSSTKRRGAAMPSDPMRCIYAGLFGDNLDMVTGLIDQIPRVPLRT